MTVTHDFTLLASWDTTDGWSGSNDVQVVAISEPKLEGSGAISIVKSGTTEMWFWAEYQFPNPIDLNNKLLVFYLYLTPDARRKLNYLRIQIYDANGNYIGLNYDHKIAGAGWKPVVIRVGSGTSGIDRSIVSKIRIIFNTPSASNTFAEGDIVVDRLLVGTGFYILYVTDTNPHTLDDVAQVDAEDNLMLVEAISRFLYIIRGKINVGNGTDVGALKIYKSVVICDTEDLQYWADGVIYVYENSFLEIEDSIIIGAERPIYPYGSSSLVISHGIFRVKNSYILTNLPLIVGVAHRMNLSLYEMTLEDFLVNYMLWMYSPTVSNMNLSGLIALLPKSSWVFDDYTVNGLDIYSTFYVFRDAELVPRSSKNLRFHSTVFAEGRFRTDGSIGELYNPVNVTKDNLAVTGINSIIKVYYDIDIYVVDRLGNPIVNANVKLYDKNNNLVAEDTTDSSGHVSFTVLVYHKETDSSGNIVIDEDYNSFTIEVLQDSSQLAKTRLEIRERKTYYITPDNVYVMNVFTDKTEVYIDEPVIITAEIRKIDGTPISGLIVNADIRKPDDTIVSVTLDEIRSGIYKGTFRLTDLVGDYEVSVYSQIDTLTVESKTKFHVGRMDLVRKVLTNNMEIKDNQLIIYDDDGATPLLKFNLYDKLGNPTEINVYKRIRTE